MKIGIVGSGRIGSNAGRLFAEAGHELMFSGSSDPAKLEAAAAEAGGAAVGSPREAVEFGEVVMFSVPWRAVDDALGRTGPLEGKIVIDTTNPIAERPPTNGVLRFFTTLDESLMERLQKHVPAALKLIRA